MMGIKQACSGWHSGMPTLADLWGKDFGELGLCS